jgi:catechol 2,3-dioxygenase-like lactoylglutathione lyase family enzyme
MRFTSITPVLFVDDIEPCLPFWTERLGFELHAHVEGDDGKHQFVLLLRDGLQVMYQTRRSVEEDLDRLGERDRHTSICLYLSVDDIDAVEAALGGLPRVQERRTTFYGATEIGVREPSGNVVVFAQHAS